MGVGCVAISLEECDTTVIAFIRVSACLDLSMPHTTSFTSSSLDAMTLRSYERRHGQLPPPLLPRPVDLSSFERTIYGGLQSLDVDPYNVYWKCVYCTQRTSTIFLLSSLRASELGSLGAKSSATNRLC